MEDRFINWNSSDRRSALSLGLDHFRGFAIFLVILILSGLVGLYFVRENIGETVRARMESEINAKVAEHGFSVSIAECELIEGKGFRVSNLAFSIKNDPQPLVTIDECFVQIPAYLPQMLLGDQTVRGLEIHRATLHIRRDSQRRWNLDNLAKLFHADQQKQKIPPFFVRDSKVVISVESSVGTRVSEIRGIDLDITQQKHFSAGSEQQLIANVFDINGALSSDFVDNVSITARIDTQSEQWAVAINANKAQFNERVFDFVPANLTGQLGPAKSFRGVFNLTGKATGDFDLTKIPQFKCRGSMFKSSLDDSSLPFAISNCSCDFELDNSKLEFTNVKGRVGSGEFDVAYSQIGLAKKAPWKLDGRLNNFTVDSPLFPWLPPNMQKFWQQYSPSGVVDLAFDMRFDGGNIKSDMTTTVKRGSFSFFKFPYRIGDCNGTIHWTNEKCTVNLQAEENGQPIRINGEMLNPGPNWTGWLDIKVMGFLPINRKAFAALANEPKLLNPIQAFAPTGEFNLVGRVERTSPTQIPPDQSFDIRFQNCSIRHRHFDYPFYGVNGLVVSRNQKVQFKQIQGSRDNGYVVCNGDWSEQTGLKLNFLCQTIALDDQLRHALPAGQQDIWDRVQPNGTVDLLNVDLEYQEGWPHPKIAVDGQVFEQRAPVKSNVAIQPSWFPYRVEEVTGNFHFGDGQLTVDNFNGKHGNTWITMKGRGEYNANSWNLRLSDLLVGSLNVDEDLYRALPSHLEYAVRKLNFDGQLEIEGSFAMRGGFQDTTTTSNNPYITANYGSTKDTENEFALDWDLTLTTIGSNIFVGVPIKNVSGYTRLVGQMENGDARSVGELAIDSMVYEDAQITNIGGPISINSARVGVGTWADLNGTGNAPSPLIGNVFGGKIALDAAVACTDNGEFDFRATMQDFDLGVLAAELSSGSQDIAGRGFAGVILKGDQTGKHSVRGDGYVRLRNAKIYELPVILSLLKVSKVTNQLDRSAFDEGNVDFSVRGSDIELNRIELIGDAISLIGNGVTNTSHQIDLNFYTVMGRNRLNIPLLTQLYRASSQQILWIKVDGSLQEPHTTQEILPGLNDTLKQVFEDFESSNKDSTSSRSEGTFAPLPTNNR